jgi:acetyltransferase-like isoleucine patch superfamily enzyme
MSDSLKSLARGLAFVAISPMLLWFVVKRAVLGADRALQGSAQALALIPGLPGQYARRAFLSVAIAHCAPTCVIEFGVTFSQFDARLDDNVYVGPFCSLGRVHLERDVLVAGGVHIPSGADTHATDRSDVAIREQGGTRELVRVGQGTWIGNGAIVMADVGRDCVIGAGAVVTTAIPDRSVAVGVPARVIRIRGEL